jgi:hypothetical protein
VPHVDRGAIAGVVGPAVLGHVGDTYAKSAHASSASTTTIAAPTNT